MSLSGFSESTVNEPNENQSSVASLVYAGGHLNGYRAPTARDIPQLRIATLDTPPSDDEFRSYQNQLRDFSEIEPPVQMPSLDSVPSVFNSSEFALDNPRVFAQVVGTDETIDYTILLEKMSWYIDIVELHLLDRISNASSSFFKVTSQFNDIEASAQQTTQALNVLSNTIADIDKFKEHEQQTLALAQKLDSLSDLSSHLEQLKRFYNAYCECKQLISSNIPLAATKIAPTRSLLTDGHDLRPIVALKPAIVDLDEFDVQVATYYENELVKELLNDLNTHIYTVPQKDTLDRIGRILHVPGHKQSHNYNNSWTDVTPELRSTLEQLVQGALDVSVLDSALAQYKDALTREVKALVRQSLPNSRDPDSKDGAGALAASLKALSVAEFEHIVAALFAHLSECFRRISTQSKLLMDVCSRLGHPPLIGDLLESIVTLTDSRLTKVLKVRRDINATISVNDFMHIYSLCGIFMTECESICGIYAPELSAYLASQTELYSREFYRTRSSELLNSLEHDAWKKEELPEHFQTTVDLVVESGDQDPVVWLRQWRAVIDGDARLQSNNRKLPQNVFVKDTSHFITRSTVKLVTIISDLLELVCLLPQTTGELASQYSELFELFNSKTRHLILGTGAMTSGSGLKRITFRHLSLAYESLGFTHLIYEYSKGCVIRHLNDPSVFAEACQLGIDKLKQHQGDIENKFISIMTDKAQSYSRSISITNWGMPAQTANQYMQNLVKDLSTVSRILEDTLDKPTAVNIVSRIFDVYKPILLESYTGLRVQNSTALKNIMQDIAFFRDHIGDIKGSGNFGEILYESMSAFATPEESDEPRRSISPAHPAAVEADMTVGDISEADISAVTTPTATPSRYKRVEKSLPEVPQPEVPQDPQPTLSVPSSKELDENVDAQRTPGLSSEGSPVPQKVPEDDTNNGSAESVHTVKFPDELSNGTELKAQETVVSEADKVPEFPSKQSHEDTGDEYNQVLDKESKEHELVPNKEVKEHVEEHNEASLETSEPQQPEDTPKEEVKEVSKEQKDAPKQADDEPGPQEANPVTPDSPREQSSAADTDTQLSEKAKTAPNNKAPAPTSSKSNGNAGLAKKKKNKKKGKKSR